MSECKNINIFDTDEEYLIDFVHNLGKTIIDDEHLPYFYELYSQKFWSASWEDNCEGDFIEWLHSIDLFNYHIKRDN